VSLTLHYHPLSSFCWKALIGLYENDTPFTPLVVDLGEEASRAAFLSLWPIGKFPVLRDDARDVTVPETSVILDYLDAHHPGPVRFTPADPDAAWRTRLWDRFFDLYVMTPMQKIVGDRIRPSDDQRDPFGVEQARGKLATSYGVLEAELAGRTWMSGDGLRPGRLRGAAGAVLRQQGAAARPGLSGGLERPIWSRLTARPVRRARDWPRPSPIAGQRAACHMFPG
jgi:glutathione S-transferase